jgi:hypothetical protein
VSGRRCRPRAAGSQKLEDCGPKSQSTALICKKARKTVPTSSGTTAKNDQEESITVRSLLPTFRTSRDEFLRIPGTTQSVSWPYLTSFPRNPWLLAEPTIRSRQRAVGPFLSRTRQLSIDILFHARPVAIVSSAITRVWAEKREKSWGKQGPTEVDPARSRWF